MGAPASLMGIGKTTGLKVLVWVLCLALLAPPTALAQGLSGSSTTPVPYGMVPGGTAAPLPGQPIITNPTALQPIVPAQVHCPAPAAPSQTAGAVMPSLNEFWPTETGTLLPSSVEQRMRQEREERQEKVAKSQAGLSSTAPHVLSTPSQVGVGD